MGTDTPVTRTCEQLAGGDWNLSVGQKPDGSYAVTIDRMQAVLLWEILQELRKLNRLLHCGSFMAIPSQLDRIRKATNRIPPRKRKRRLKKETT